MSDGTTSICSRPCMPSSDSCPSGYSCAEIADSGGSGGCWPDGDTCTGKQDPQPAGADETCSASIACKTGLVCVLVTDTAAKCLYTCTPPSSSSCPSGVVCKELEGGGGACMGSGGGGGGGGGGADADGGTGDGGLLGDLAGCNCSVTDTTVGDASGLLALAALALGLLLVARKRR